MATVQILGRLIKDPEVKTTQSGAEVVRFSVADNTRGKDKTDFFDCAAFGKTGELIGKFFAKGKQIWITGLLESWKSEDGKTHYQVQVDRAFFVQSGQNT